MNVYAVYKGDNLLAIGTIHELVKELGLKEQSIRAMGTPSYHKKMAHLEEYRVLVNLGDDID